MFRMLQGISSRRAILPSGVSKCIKNTIQESRRFFVLLILIIAASVIFALLPPLVLGKIVDSLADGKKMFFSMAVGYFLVVAISGLLDAVKESMITVLDSV